MQEVIIPAQGDQKDKDTIVPYGGSYHQFTRRIERQRYDFNRMEEVTIPGQSEEKDKDTLCTIRRKLQSLYKVNRRKHYTIWMK